MTPTVHPCANPFCAEMHAGVVQQVTGRKLCCSKDCDRARRKDLDVQKPTTEKDRIDPEAKLQAFVNKKCAEWLKEGQILCWRHNPRQLGKREVAEQKGYVDQTIGIRADLVVGVELKKIGKDLEPEQIPWRIAFGQNHILCRTETEFLSEMWARGVKNR